MAEHAKRFSPSASARWLNCPGSVKLLEQLPDGDDGSSYALEGTAAHAVAEAILRNDHVLNSEQQVYVEAWRKLVPHDDPDLETCLSSTVTVDDAMFQHCIEYANYVLDLEGVLAIEQRVDFSAYVPGGFGTADAIVYDGDTETLHVVDLKYGQGVRVDAEGNTQGLLYAVGAVCMYREFVDIGRVVVHIYQPRLDHISQAEYTLDEVIAFAEQASEAAKLALSDDAPLVPSEKACRWCEAAAICPALAKQSLSAAIEDFTSVGDTIDAVILDAEPTFTDAGLLSPSDLGHLLSLFPLIEHWMKAAREYAFQTAMETPDAVAGWKVVEGRSLRQWADEDAAAKALYEAGLTVEQLYSRSLISPAAAEKLLGKAKAKQLNDVIHKPAGKPTLAPASDKRHAINLDRGSEFAPQVNAEEKTA